MQITAGTIYVASYHTNVGHESDDLGYFAGQGANDGPLHALEDESGSRNSVYLYGSGGFPSNISPSSDNYWVDVVFATSAELAADSGKRDAGAQRRGGAHKHHGNGDVQRVGVQSGTINFDSS